jgi:hypothetical protein
MNQNQKLYSYEEYGELLDREARLFYTSYHLAAHRAQGEEEPARTRFEWDQAFDIFVAERRAKRGPL